MKNPLSIGDTVFWNDPDNGVSSGYYSVADVLADDDGEVYEDTIVCLKNESGSEAEVYFSELTI